MENLLCEICKNPTFKCGCETDNLSFDDILKTNCYGDTQNGVIYTPINISTMTICFNFNQFIDLAILKEILNEKILVSYKPGSRKSKIKKKKGTDSFYNSFDIKLTLVDRSVEPMVFKNVSIFIFPNVKVKAAGIRTTNTIKVMIDELIEIIKYVNGINGTNYLNGTNEAPVVKNIETFAAENIKIQMICSDFKIKPIKEDSDGWCIKQEDLKNILVSRGYSATFSALSRYPGINLKYPSKMEKDKQISLLIFRSGSIIITGAKYADDISESYKFITNIISNNNNLFYYDINEEIKQKKKKSNVKDK